MAKSSKDIYTQRLIATVEPALGAGSSEFVAFTDAYSPSDLVGFIVKEVSYNFENPLLQVLAANADRIKFGLSFLETMPVGGMEANDPGVLDHHAITRRDVVALAADVMHIEQNPLAKRDFTRLGGVSPQNGLLVHPVNLFAWCYYDTAVGVTARIHVTIEYITITITDALHKDLWQSIYVRSPA